MQIMDQFKGDYINAAQLNGARKRVTISGVEIAAVTCDGQKKDKPVLHFNEIDEGLVLNKTNAAELAARLGPDSDTWTGRQILLCPEQTDFGGKRVACVRVKVPEARPQPAKVAEPDPEWTEEGS